MTCIIDTKSNRHMSAKLAARLVLAAIVALGSSVGSARAQQHGDNHHGQDNHDYSGFHRDHLLVPIASWSGQRGKAPTRCPSL